MAVNNKLKLAVLASGRGSNLQALMDAARKRDFPAQIAVVVANVADAQALERAKKAGIPAILVEHKGKTREAFEQALLDAIAPHAPDIICLAGFMRILTGGFLNNCHAPVLNIHPSLLPKYKGLDTHARAIAAGDRVAGCSVHIVTPDLDAGPVIVQAQVNVKKDDTPQTLAERVLREEHALYPEAVRIMARNFTGS